MELLTTKNTVDLQSNFVEMKIDYGYFCPMGMENLLFLKS